MPYKDGEASEYPRRALRIFNNLEMTGKKGPTPSKMKEPVQYYRTSQQRPHDMDFRPWVLLLLLLASCMPQSQVSKGNLASNGAGPGAAPTPNNTSVPTLATSWNFLSTNTTTITINVSNLNNAYIVGSDVEKYLATLDTTGALQNFTSINYCLVGHFILGGRTYQLRSRVVPISYYDFTSKRTVRVLRVDFDDETNSQSLCTGQLRIQDQTGTFINDTSIITATLFRPYDICPTCTSMITATNLRMFKKDTSELKQVSLSSFSLSNLILQVDPNYNATGSAETCTNSSCIARGFNCCLDNQCVNDGAKRPSADVLYSAQYNVAEQERLLNPLAYVNYPQIYYVCGTTPIPSTGGSTTGGSSGGVNYDAGFAQLKKDYYCVEHIKAQATSVPFHSELLSRTYTSATDCLTDVSQSTQTMYYRSVMKRLYSTCGCSRTDLSDMINSCPAYDYTVVLRDTNGVPTRIDCYTPPGQVAVPPVQNVTFSARSAPHRFFESLGGLEKDILGNEKTYVLAGVTHNHLQEGAAFSYLDEGGIMPQQSDFSMNAILGPMTVDLMNALPAKVVRVELDQVYFLTTTSGFYSPCPSCMKDSWISSFTAFPTSALGTGLQHVGHTTSRDSLGNNFTAGNYEDTIFGRACWIPPTMVAFSHSEKTTVRDQRTTRLSTQAALYVNGYQRDWYGFNKGAVIGSFDGVTWFAIGKGRIVRSTSKKLFLAINAPFADQASPNLQTVQIQSYDGIITAAQVDYDPTLSLSHPYQNEAGTCQANHQCQTDIDCITRLGWEYTCAEIKDLKTKWPTFDVNGNELVGAETYTLDQILQQKRFGGSSTRCLYRGAGAPCTRNLTAVSDTNIRKALTCAPNFYCADINLSPGHNGQVARWAANLTDIPTIRNHLFGKDANVLGRPLHYVSSGKSIPSDVRLNLIGNMSENGVPSASTQMGICQPGKRLPDDTASFNTALAQHNQRDTSGRADYINQIAGCNSALYATNRYASCPAIDMNSVSNPNFGNYVPIDSTTSINLKRAQNSCGLESLKGDTDNATLAAAATLAKAQSLTSKSPFRLLESNVLTGTTISEPTFARDACFRRAGAVCHTDYDCSPNSKHAEQVDYFTLDFFGNLAEKKYFQESLVCGQADPQPSASDSAAFRSFNMNKNRCCRQVGSDLSTYSANVPKSSTVTYSGIFGFGSYLGDYDPATLLRPDRQGTAPKDVSRYSRFLSIPELGTANFPYLSGNIDQSISVAPFPFPGNFKADAVGGPVATGLVTHANTPHQWKTLNLTNKGTCCGGGWVRKFSDNTTNWERRNRLVLDVANFRCLNSRSRLLTAPEELVVPTAFFYDSFADLSSLIAVDGMDYCVDVTGARGNCAQYFFTSRSSEDRTEDMPVSDAYPTNVELNTMRPDFVNRRDVLFLPTSADSDPAINIDFSNASGRRNISFKLPSYVSRIFDATYANTANGTGGQNIRLVESDGTTIAGFCQKLDGMVFSSLTDGPLTCPVTGLMNCCYSFDTITRILRVVASSAASPPVVGSPYTDKRVGVLLSFDVAGSAAAPRPPLPAVPTYTAIPRSRPGTDLYYLARFGLLELSGIPQIGMEPLYCSDNSDKLVPGIFKTSNPVIKTKDNFESPLVSYPGCRLSSCTTPGASNRLAPSAMLDHDPIFSANEFKCCSPLGKIVSDVNRCCSGFGLPFGDGTASTCALPKGTDLMVYFNRFVSNEGVDETGPGGGLKDADFSIYTGEPLTTTAVNDKIRALGRAFCDGGQVRQGGAFGNFLPEPQGPSTNLTRNYQLVDSSRDSGQNTSGGTPTPTGYQAFMDGFRWNHHLYCADDN